MTRWKWDSDWRDKLVNSHDVRNVMDRAGLIVEVGAKRRAPVSQDGSGGHPPGRLRDSISRTEGHDNRGPYVDVGTDVEYALAQELGARPHLIVSHGPWPLRDRYGNVFGRVVQHPGNEPQPYLRPALDDLAGREL